MDKVIELIHKQFLDEAANSPVLISDLANLEKYIAESYSGRSLLELLQNSDDAGANRFHISVIDDTHTIVANDGREFTEDDIISLCRSGASTKKRKGNSIGFRGIGFKSVVNYANEVHLISGSTALSFSRKLTSELLPAALNVPLIRIPHTFHGDKYINEIRQILEYGYTTVFIFETQNKALSEEISSFDPSCLLFLRNVSDISFDGDICRSYRTSKISKTEDSAFVTISGSDLNQEWYLINSRNYSDGISIAFLTENALATKADKTDAVIHSFMPTKDAFCILCKINGDFSTDPSRTRVVCDDESIDAAQKCATLVANIICKAIETHTNNYNVINIISELYIDPLSKFRSKNINDYFIDEVKEQVHQRFSSKKILLQPEWLDEDSYQEIVSNSNDYLITRSLELKIPGISKLLQIIGFDELDIHSVLLSATHLKLSESALASILAKIITMTRFSMDNSLKNEIQNAYLIILTDRIERISRLKLTDRISQTFLTNVKSKLSDEQDFYWFAKKIGIPQELIVSNSSEESDTTTTEDSSTLSESELTYNIQETSPIKAFEHKRFAKKWRTAEENVIEFLNTLPDVVSVEDVSLMNVGYDAEVLLKTGEKLCFEIKSVNSFGDAFVMTNNEYSLANKDGAHYYLAISCLENNSMKVCIVKNPAASLELTRRIVRWEWVCNAYTGQCYEIPYQS
ncbi:sacsin N-terminal ATP-binding-like domain-containing protein [Methanosarcina sp.]|uniref:sacsin N-terminal ATP-binding-like domain-containing protein n=1 Tax=Methanosarcina sp. TaxID=2213 RepID=UPI002AB83AF3|nr:DUF3883 domain-containing protein [Methanosarcina sp.]MDY9924898.1 ATP-binding protein [Methanosarcina sp.]